MIDPKTLKPEQRHSYQSFGNLVRKAVLAGNLKELDKLERDFPTFWPRLQAEPTA